MKKILIILVLLFCVLLPTYSQVQQNGKDWMSLTTKEKFIWLSGFFTSHLTVMQYIKETDKTKGNEELWTWLWITDTPNKIIETIDFFYNIDEKNLEFPIWNVIYIIFERVWWEKKDKGTQ